MVMEIAIVVLIDDIFLMNESMSDVSSIDNSI